MENWFKYRSDNRTSWNERTPIHISSAMYDVPGFLTGKSSLKAPEMELLGEVIGKEVLHPQCHFGLDTLSLARMGAHVTGLDFSDEAIRQAERLAEQCGLEARFVCSDVYDMGTWIEPESKDLVFVTYGAICWLPDLHIWAKLLSRTLKPGGRLLLVEFHPVLYIFDFTTRNPDYPYFPHSAPITEEQKGTYADKEAAIKNVDHFWTHPFSEVLDALLEAGLQLTHFREWDYSPWDCFDNMREVAPGQFRFEVGSHPLPHLFGLVATKN